jgi:hypothetical protein
MHKSSEDLVIFCRENPLSPCKNLPLAEFASGKILGIEELGKEMGFTRFGNVVVQNRTRSHMKTHRVSTIA